MKTRKRLTALVLALLVSGAPALTLGTLTTVAVLQTGCSAILPGQDVVVVRAEQTAAGAFEIMDAFVTLEETNREALRKLSPEIEKAANKVRRDGRKSLEELRTVTKIYKQNRTPENKATILTWTAVVQDLQRIAQENIATAKLAGVAR